MRLLTILLAHKKRFLQATMFAKSGVRKAVDSLGKINKSLEAMEGHRRRVMMIGYYLYHTAETDPDYRLRDMGYECVNTLHYGFNRRRLRRAQQQSGLERLLKMEFNKF